ncbi:hypothetical protein [Paenisporosarcina quisquiliarum]|uniref:hypothetical protein n=1 Tax=Paenisporosarcina quisquiliarum TaxID=365346 RepID=UPI0037361500
MERKEYSFSGLGALDDMLLSGCNHQIPSPKVESTKSTYLFFVQSAGHGYYPV